MEVKILGVEDGMVYDAVISEVDMTDFETILKTGHFTVVPWTGIDNRNQGEVFKLSLGDKVLGLIQYFNENNSQHIIQIDKLEIAYKVPDKKYENVAGCLIAYCCYRSNQDVFVHCSGERLRNHYITKYEMKQPVPSDGVYETFYIKCDKANGERLIAKYLST